jgi:putative ABC transport system permease protein
MMSTSPPQTRPADTTSMTLKESFDASPGYTAETSTLQLIQVFLYLISALVVGAFFTVLTIQRRGEIAVLRALGGRPAICWATVCSSPSSC